VSTESHAILSAIFDTVHDRDASAKNCVKLFPHPSLSINFLAFIATYVYLHHVRIIVSNNTNARRIVVMLQPIDEAYCDDGMSKGRPHRSNRISFSESNINGRSKMKSTILPALLCLLLLSCKNESPIQHVSMVDAKDRITANFKSGEVDLMTHALGMELNLKSVSSREVNIDGTSMSWTYRYGMIKPPYSYYYFTATYETVKFDSTAPVATGDAFISHAWNNSSDALKIAERTAGEKFRADNPGCIIKASVGEPLVPNATTYWYVTYQKNVNANGMHVTIDATNGNVIEIYNIPPR
jgi:hypothetical protein